MGQCYKLNRNQETSPKEVLGVMFYMCPFPFQPGFFTKATAAVIFDSDPKPACCTEGREDPGSSSLRSAEKSVIDVK